MHKLTALSFLLVAACGGASAPCPVDAANAASSSTSAQAAASPPCADAPAMTDAADPDILQLASAAKTCTFENNSFDWNCPAYKAWTRDNDDLFEGGSGNATILKMLEDDDIKSRALAVERGFSAGRNFFADKKHAQRLLAVVDKERESRLLSQYGRYLAFIDAERADLKNEMKAYTKHSSEELRASLAAAMLPQHPNAFSLELAKVMLDDADNSVKRSAIASLSGNGRTRPSPEICATLKTQLARTDKLAEDAIDAAASSKCEGMQALAIAEAEKRSADPKKLSGSDGIDLRSPLTSICWRSGVSDDLKKRAFDIAAKVAPTLDDSWKKRFWLDIFRNCDVKRAKAALTPFANDKDKEVAKEAKEEIKRVDEELKHK